MKVILIGIGANLPTPEVGGPRATCGAALEALAKRGVTIDRCSRWYESAPVPESDQPWFVNAVVRIKTPLDADALMAALIETEQQFGRERAERNAARNLDLDLLAYGELVVNGPPIDVPHPRMAERAFVLRPLADVAPDWRHPATGEGIGALIAALPADQEIRVMADAGGVFGTEWRERPPSIAPAGGDDGAV